MANLIVVKGVMQTVAQNRETGALVSEVRDAAGQYDVRLTVTGRPDDLRAFQRKNVTIVVSDDAAETMAAKFAAGTLTEDDLGDIRKRAEAGHANPAETAALVDEVKKLRSGV